MNRWEKLQGLDALVEAMTVNLAFLYHFLNFQAPLPTILTAKVILEFSTVLDLLRIGTMGGKLLEFRMLALNNSGSIKRIQATILAAPSYILD